MPIEACSHQIEDDGLRRAQTAVLRRHGLWRVASKLRECLTITYLKRLPTTSQYNLAARGRDMEMDRCLVPVLIDVVERCGADRKPYLRVS